MGRDLVGEMEAQKASMKLLRERKVKLRPAGEEWDPTDSSLEHVFDDISSGARDADYEFDFIDTDSFLAHVVWSWHIMCR